VRYCVKIYKIEQIAEKLAKPKQKQAIKRDFLRMYSGICTANKAGETPIAALAAPL
jgi:hypothetical protein